MDDLLSEFLTETAESLDVIDVELVKFEQEPNNASILDNIFRLVHPIKVTCGFHGLPRLEALAHAAEILMGKYRDGSRALRRRLMGRTTGYSHEKGGLGPPWNFLQWQRLPQAAASPVSSSGSRST
jgi:chemotaxis protein histidine kinase CheA